MAAVSLGASLVCSVGATWFACHTELRLLPANLMRPKAPKPGKRILLERVRFIWSRVSFLHKVSIRNILRYKKRLFMMLLGIGGCTALIVAGFGIRDSIATIADTTAVETPLASFKAQLGFAPSQIIPVRLATIFFTVAATCS